MNIRFHCEFCGKHIETDSSLKAVQCPYCKKVVPVGSSEERLIEDEQVENKAISLIATYIPTWGSSVVMHIAIILIAMMTTAMAFSPPTKVEYTAEVVQKEHRNFIQKNFSQLSSRNTRNKLENPSSFVFAKSVNFIPDVSSNNLTPVDVIGIGGGGNIIGGLDGWGEGRGVGDPSWFGDGGTQKNRNIVYIIDRSGSMTDSIMYVKHQLKKSIQFLRPFNKFYILFYSSGPAIGMPINKLLPATEQNKQTAYEFIDGIVPISKTDPSDALERAFGMNPDVIHLLTDGEFGRDIVGLIDRLNKTKKIPINTYCFLYINGEPILKEIAYNNQGIYKYISESDLGD